jgi:hypothetical protein
LTFCIREKGLVMPTISFPAGSAFADAAFDTDATRLLSAAFEAAWQVVQSSGAVADEAYAASIRECLAKRVIEMGRRGERNHDRLVEEALLYLAKSRGARDVASASVAEQPVSQRQSG